MMGGKGRVSVTLDPEIVAEIEQSSDCAWVEHLGAVSLVKIYWSDASVYEGTEGQAVYEMARINAAFAAADVEHRIRFILSSFGN